MKRSDLATILVIAFLAVTWIGVAEHPTARNIRRAIRETLPFL